MIPQSFCISPEMSLARLRKRLPGEVRIFRMKERCRLVPVKSSRARGRATSLIWGLVGHL